VISIIELKYRVKSINTGKKIHRGKEKEKRREEREKRRTIDLNEDRTKRRAGEDSG